MGGCWMEDVDIKSTFHSIPKSWIILELILSTEYFRKFWALLSKTVSISYKISSVLP